MEYGLEGKMEVHYKAKAAAWAQSFQRATLRQ